MEEYPKYYKKSGVHNIKGVDFVAEFSNFVYFNDNVYEGEQRKVLPRKYHGVPVRERSASCYIRTNFGRLDMDNKDFELQPGTIYFIKWGNKTYEEFIEYTKKIDREGINFDEIRDLYCIEAIGKPVKCGELPDIKSMKNYKRSNNFPLGIRLYNSPISYHFASKFNMANEFILFVQSDKIKRLFEDIFDEPDYFWDSIGVKDYCYIFEENSTCKIDGKNVNLDFMMDESDSKSDSEDVEIFEDKIFEILANKIRQTEKYVFILYYNHAVVYLYLNGTLYIIDSCHSSLHREGLISYFPLNHKKFYLNWQRDTKLCKAWVMLIYQIIEKNLYLYDTIDDVLESLQEFHHAVNNFHTLSIIKDVDKIYISLYLYIFYLYKTNDYDVSKPIDLNYKKYLTFYDAKGTLYDEIAGEYNKMPPLMKISDDVPTSYKDVPQLIGMNYIIFDMNKKSVLDRYYISDDFALKILGGPGKKDIDYLKLDKDIVLPQINIKDYIVPFDENLSTWGYSVFGDKAEDHSTNIVEGTLKIYFTSYNNFIRRYNENVSIEEIEKYLPQIAAVLKYKQYDLSKLSDFIFRINIRKYGVEYYKLFLLLCKIRNYEYKINIGLCSELYNIFIANMFSSTFQIFKRPKLTTKIIEHTEENQIIYANHDYVMHKRKVYGYVYKYKNAFDECLLFIKDCVDKFVVVGPLDNPSIECTVLDNYGKETLISLKIKGERFVIM